MSLKDLLHIAKAWATVALIVLAFSFAAMSALIMSAYILRYTLLGG